MGALDPSPDPGANLREECDRIVELARELQESASVFLSQTWNQEQSLRQRALALDSAIQRLQSSVESAAKTGDIDPKDAEKVMFLTLNPLRRFCDVSLLISVDFGVLLLKLNEELCRARCVITDGDVSSFLPTKSHGRFLRMFLGPINVRAMRKDVQLKMKEDYNNHKDRIAFLFILFPSILLLLKSWIWNGCFPALAVQLYQAWLLFLYTRLALRENILRVNGSDIRSWWIYHHYCAMLMALVSITWEIKGQPDCARKQVTQRGVQLYLAWTMMQGVAMLLQNRYQRQRLYTRIALGKAKRMDVVWGETAGVSGQLWLLCPILFILQGFEAYVGLLLVKMAVADYISEWQVIVCGFLLVVMAVGNFVNTVQTLIAKSRFKAKMKKGKIRHESEQEPPRGNPKPVNPS